MRPSVVILFLLIFASASLIWIANDPKMEAVRDGSIISGMVGGDEPDTSSKPATTKAKPQPALDAQTRRVVTLEESVSALGRRLSQVEKQLAASRDSDIIKGLQEALAAQETAIAAQNTEMDALRKAAPLRIESAVINVQKGDKGWKLANMFSKKRLYRKRIDFATAFNAPPSIVIGISDIEFLNEKTRLRSSAVDIDVGGFTLELESRSDSRIGEVGISWAAFGG